MIVYVESNFVLELGLRQEEHEPCERILQHAETDATELVVPAYSLVEPYETWHRKASDREEARDLSPQDAVAFLEASLDGS